MMSWNSAIAGWLAWLGSGGLARKSLRLRRYQVLRLATDLGGRPGDVTAAVLSAWLAPMVWGRETLRSELAGLRSFFGWCVETGVIDADPSSGLRRVSALPGVPRPAPEAAVRQALAAADERVRLMIELAALHGLRVGEIAVVDVGDVVACLDGCSLLVHGKGGRERVVPLLDATAARIRAAGVGWVFPSGLGSHLSSGHVGKLITRALPAGVTPHMLRHRFATVVYRRTLDIRNLQALLGHASVATTQRYAAPDAAVLRAVAAAAA